jgi:nucleotide-binding universal stress UspA family protein
MLNIRRILFPTDFSDGAARAFPQAVALAEAHDAELHILNVTGSHEEAETTLPVFHPTLHEWFGASSPENGPDLDALSIVQNQIDGDVPPEEITGYVEEQGMDLVVMGTHGRRWAQRMLLGSVTEEVVRTAACPVLTVQTDVEETPGQDVRRILVPVDFSDASETAVEHAAELAQTYDTQIELLHVVEEVTYPSAYGVDPVYMPPQEMIPRVEESLGEIAQKKIGHEGVQISATVGYAPLTILDHIEDNDVDLVVIATHGRTGLGRMLLGSVAERVIRRSAVPVFIVKPEQNSLLPAAASTEATDEV